MSKRWLKIAILLALVFFFADQSISATTYYVDYTNGLDSNNGTAKSTPWKYAPGMAAVSGVANSTKINPGDSVILKGCVTWPNAAFTWQFPYAGSSGLPIYVGVDKTWWDQTVSGCSSSWNRPIFNLGGAAPTDSLYRIILLTESYVTYDNFEITNVGALPSPVNQQTNLFDWGGNSETNVIVEDMYVHGWVNPVFAVGTGNVAASGTSVTNFVPYSYSPAVNTSWPSTYSGLVRLQTTPCCNIITAGNSSPTVTSITGSNPYTINFSESPSNTGSGCTGCTVLIGMDVFKISGGVEGTCTGCIMQNNVIDGSDTVEAQINPYGDCGATESDNQYCVASGDAGWRQPNIWRGNVIRYVSNGFVGECSEWSNNLMEYIRGGTDPTNHTNVIECVDETASNNLYYNNVQRHFNNPNASVPGGQWSLGVLDLLGPQSGYTDYVFNNVTYDGIQNVTWGFETNGTNCCGSVTLFNNTSDGGPTFSSQNEDLANSCPSLYTACTLENNHLISNIVSSVLSGCGSNCATHTGLVQSLSTASGLRYSISLMYPYSPSTQTSSTMAAGTNGQSFCTAISAFNANAGAACQSDTTFGVVYNTTNHTISATPARNPMTRPASGLSGWSIGAYQVPEPAPPTNLTGVSP